MSDVDIMSSFGTLFPRNSDYMGAWDLPEPTTFTIVRFTRTAVEGERGPVDRTIIHYDRGKPHIACQTVGICLREMFGERPKEWLGKRVTLYAGKIEIGGQRGEPGIRVWGSPDLLQPRDVRVKFRKHPAFTVHLHAVSSSTTPTAAKPQRSVEGDALLQRMANATTQEDLDSVESDLTDAHSIPSDETQFLARALIKRRGQLGGAQ